MRRSTANSQMVNIGDLEAKMQICAVAVERSTLGYTGGSTPTSLGKMKGRVRSVWR
jgi:hypothetical protein